MADKPLKLGPLDLDSPTANRIRLYLGAVAGVTLLGSLIPVGQSLVTMMKALGVLA